MGYNPPVCRISPVKFCDYYQFDHYKPVAESGAINVVYNIEDMPGAHSRRVRAIRGTPHAERRRLI